MVIVVVTVDGGNEPNPSFDEGGKADMGMGAHRKEEEGEEGEEEKEEEKKGKLVRPATVDHHRSSFHRR